MRHGDKINNLGRKSAHRKAMLANMAGSLIMHKRISTTLAKAKALRVYVEPLLTKSKTDSTHSRRTVFASLKDKNVVDTLFKEVSGKIADRNGGYTRILKTGNRLGDNAEMCIIELVDYNENLLTAKQPKKAKSTRRRGGKKKAAATPAVETEAKEEAIPEAEIIEEVNDAPKKEAEDKPEVEAKKEEEAPAAEAKEETKAEAKKEAKPKAKKADEEKKDSKESTNDDEKSE